ncbi:hypothetical protein BSKO_01399 [Bryopsis sp. KO-2023]|nr:hypothetical protein BSKO_01399 [Bryopsis sp. KO-2023]
MEEVLSEIRNFGYAIVEKFLTDAQVEVLREESDNIVELAFQQKGARGSDNERAAREFGCIFEALPRWRCQNPEAWTSNDVYFTERAKWPCSPYVRDIIQGSVMMSVLTGLLGPSPFLLNDQHIVKQGNSTLSGFGWHKDSDRMTELGAAHRQYISVWCALDDINPGNGGLVVKPYLEQAADPIDAPAGTAVLLSSNILHKSGPNRTSHPRRAWMPQFSREPILLDNNPVSFAVPLE